MLAIRNAPPKQAADIGRLEGENELECKDIFEISVKKLP